MTDAATPAAVCLTADDQSAADWPDTVRSALRRGRPVEFSLVPEDASPWFVLRMRDGAILVHDASARHLGTFGSVEAAVARGWERGGFAGMTAG